jgi:hypothetical protein
MKRTRLLLLGAMLMLVSLVSWTKVEALTCIGVCLNSFESCSVACHNNGTCHDYCEDGLQLCEANCR